MGEKRMLISSRRNTGQVSHLTGVHRGQQAGQFFRTSREGSVRNPSSKKRTVSFTPYLYWLWCPRGSPFLIAQKIRVPEEGSTRLQRAGIIVRREADGKETRC